MRSINLSEYLPPQKVARLGDRVEEKSTSGYQEIKADGVFYRYRKKEKIEGLRKARMAVSKDGLLYVQENGTPQKKRPSYFAFHDKLYDKIGFNNYVQIDLNGAYWNIAYGKGYISDETYFDHRKNKAARNMALGTWATRKDVTTYKKGKIFSNEVEYKPTRNLFFDTSSYCFNVMASVMSKYVEEITFCWVDAIFCPEKIAKEIQSDLKKLGFGSSYDPINFLMSDKKKLYLYMGKERVKTFNLPKFEKNNFNHILTNKNNLL